MNTMQDLKQEERASFLTYFNDGILEIVVGVIALGIFAWIKADIPALVGAWAAVCVPLWALLKRKITAQRIGLVNFKGESSLRKKRSKQLFRLGLGLFLLAGIVIFMMRENMGDGINATFHAIPLLPFYLIGIMGLVILAWNIKLKRYWYLALLVALAVVVSYYTGADGLTGILVVGLVFLGVGGALLFQFMKLYPKPNLAD